MEIIAERRLIAKSRNGEERATLNIRIFGAELDEQLSCSRSIIQFSGIFTETHAIAGDDSIDCLRLAIKFIDQHLTDLAKEYELRWDDDSHYDN